MALEFGYALYQSDPVIQAHCKKKYQALTEEDKKFYQNTLPLLLLFSDVGLVCESYIPAIVTRLESKHQELYHEICEELRARLPKDESELRVYLRRFTGFRVNVITLDNKQWLKDYMKMLRQRVASISIRNDHRHAQELYLAEMPPETLPLMVNTKWASPEVAELYHKRLAAGDSKEAA